MILRRELIARAEQAEREKHEAVLAMYWPGFFVGEEGECEVSEERIRALSREQHRLVVEAIEFVRKDRDLHFQTSHGGIRWFPRSRLTA